MLRRSLLDHDGISGGGESIREGRSERGAQVSLVDSWINDDGAGEISMHPERRSIVVSEAPDPEDLKAMVRGEIDLVRRDKQWTSDRLLDGKMPSVKAESGTMTARAG